MIMKPGSGVESGDGQTAADTGRQESRTGTEGCGVLRKSQEAGRSGTGQGQQLKIDQGLAGKTCGHRRSYNLPLNVWKGGVYIGSD